MRTQVNENFQFTDEGFHCGNVCLRSNHFDGHCFDSFTAAFDPNRFSFDDSSKTTRSQLYP